MSSYVAPSDASVKYEPVDVKDMPKYVVNVITSLRYIITMKSSGSPAGKEKVREAISILEQISKLDTEDMEYEVTLFNLLQQSKTKLTKAVKQCRGVKLGIEAVLAHFDRYIDYIGEALANIELSDEEPYEYTLQECIESNLHLDDVDEEGFCILCGEKDS